MKLYYFPGSCALAPHIVLEWLGADFEAIRIEKGDPEYLNINPLGVVPALDNGRRTLTQADAILHYLSDTHPDAELGGHGSADAAYDFNYWMAFLTVDLHPAWFPFFNPQRYNMIKDDATLTDTKAASQILISKFYTHLDRHLDGRTYIAGESPTIADAYAIPMLRWGRLLDGGLGPYTALDGYLKHWEGDGGVHSAMVEQGLARSEQVRSNST